MADPRQSGLLDLFSHISKPQEPELSLRETSGASLVPTAEEAATIRNNLNLRAQGIGIAPRGRPCSLFDWENMVEAMALARLFTRQTSYDEFVRVSSAVRGVVNEEILVFAMMYAILNRKDTRSLQLPPVEEVVPYWYFPSTVITEADHRVKEALNETEKVVVSYEFAHNELDPEFRVAYFREDISLNSHHWHWHLAYPFTWTPVPGDEIKDRKGELFYYMHQQVMARYDAERLSNGLGRVTPITDFRHPFEEGYFPNLTSTISGRQYASRPADSIPKDTIDVSIERMGLWKTRIMDAIHSKNFINKEGVKVPLIDPNGINVLGDLLEATALSVNRDFYGDYHNFGHRLISRVHDPDGRFGGERGVMGFSATAMRDPIFYKWHKTIDDIFDEYKRTLSPYTKPELEWSDIDISNISIFANASRRGNFLQTFWQERQVLLSQGVDFGRPNPVAVSFRHLNHEEFVYDIAVENRSNSDRNVVFRIYLAPISNELNDPISLNDQRRLFIELEKYQVIVKPGKQTLKRRSEDSNVTLPTIRGFEQLSSGSPNQPPDGFCGCGWPGHLLIPKGRSEGMRFVLIVIATDWEKDKVDNLPEKRCSDAASYCGIRDQRYPDKKTMGFPFDRRFPVSETLESLALLSNIATKEIIIRHSGQIVDPKGVFQPAPIF